MKNLFLLTLAVVLSTNLNARENPFEITSAYEEESGRIIESYEPQNLESLQEAQYIKEMQEKMSKVRSLDEKENKNKVEDAVQKIVPLIKDGPKPVKTYSKKEVDSIIHSTKKQTEKKTKEIIKKELSKSQKQIAEPAQVVYVKPRADIAENEELVSKKILPFVKIEFNDNRLIINASEYKVFKKFSIAKENKLIIDYKAKINFYTKREDIDSKNFKKISVGNHKSKGYFRVVIELDDKPSKYDVSYENNLITISKIS